LAGAVLTFFGLMHGERIGFAQTLPVAASYLIVSGILIGCAKFAPAMAMLTPTPEPAAEQVEPAHTM
jgi:AGZA family xanthine/uracil permease-like MFS transporter